MSSLTDLHSALDAARNTMALSSRDWSTSHDLAWLYGILCGWDGEPEGGDVDQGNAMAELAEQFGWTDADVARLRRLHAAVEAFDINRIAGLLTAEAAARAAADNAPDGP